jgi:hypothetical protein
MRKQNINFIDEIKLNDIIASNDTIANAKTTQEVDLPLLFA